MAPATDPTAAAAPRVGPLSDLRVVEFAGIGPGPFATMLLSDMGADVLRIDRRGAGVRPPTDVVSRGRRVVELDLQQAVDVGHALDLLARADVLIEGFRPGVMERLGLGPEVVLQRNPALVYGRLTGWGQTGPLARTAGHDINYIALAGALAAMGPRGGEPLPPMNLVGDYGGGSLYLTTGILAALHAVRRSGKGQVVDAAIVDGTASLMALYAGRVAKGDWSTERGSNMLDGAAHFYRSYATADGRHMAVGAIEPKFYASFCAILGVDPADFPQQERARWAQMGEALAAIFRTRSQAAWTAAFEGSDACVSPVLPYLEAQAHPQLAARGSYCEVAGVVQPGPAPRFSVSGQAVQGPAPSVLTSVADALGQWPAP